MKTLVHVSTSAMLSGTVYAATYSPDIAIACFLSGILLDLDHLLDYFSACPRTIFFKKLQILV